MLITTSASLVTKLASYQIEEIKNPKKKEVTENDKTKKGTIKPSSPSKTQKKDTEEKTETQLFETKLSLLEQLYLYGNRNLKGILESDIPEALVEILMQMTDLANIWFI